MRYKSVELGEESVSIGKKMLEKQDETIGKNRTARRLENVHGRAVRPVRERGWGNKSQIRDVVEQKFVFLIVIPMKLKTKPDF
ncbi:hypothetical protein C5S35_11530 [Candidatus Methanophagaceae archaeon]|nr:hypothetical protein C5S35_11530 [Methanophagales archaeon]